MIYSIGERILAQNRLIGCKRQAISLFINISQKKRLEIKFLRYL